MLAVRTHPVSTPAPILMQFLYLTSRDILSSPFCNLSNSCTQNLVFEMITADSID